MEREYRSWYDCVGMVRGAALAVLGAESESRMLARRLDDSRAWVDLLPTAALLLSKEGRILAANARAAEVLRKPVDALEQASIERVMLPLPELTWSDRFGEARPTLKLTLPGSGRVVIGYTLVALGGELAASHGWAYSLTFQDITEHERLREERDRLLQLATVGEVLPTILHELKNPLAAIIAAVEVLIEDVAPGRMQTDLHAILSEMRRLQLGLEGIGSVGRTLRSGRTWPIDAALRDALALMETRAQGRGIYVRSAISDMPLLPFEPAVMRAVLFNVVNNAIQACPEGATVRVTAELIESGKVFSLEIIDNGPGMTQDVLDRCTDLFFTTKRSGSGIGLALCKRIAEEAFGCFRVESVPGYGTRVALRVPIQERDATVTHCRNVAKGGGEPTS